MPDASDSGVLNLHKPVGPTSFQMVALIRRLTGSAKVGHAGTLDPLASGVLPICVGRAVRMSEYLLAEDKVYQAEITFGVRTTTDDGEGAIVAQHAVTITQQQLDAVLLEFIGLQEQVPPQFAAIKQAGKPAYELARQGKVVELAPRAVHIERLTLLEWQPPRARVEVACGKGTYIRALARDMGERLGCGAYLSGLIRTQAGDFLLRDAVRPEVLEAAADWREYLLPLDYGLKRWPAAYLTEAETRRIVNGVGVSRPDEWPPDALIRGYDQRREFFAVLYYDRPAGVLRPQKVFNVEVGKRHDEQPE